MEVRCAENYYQTELDDYLIEKELDFIHQVLLDTGYELDRWTAQGLWLDFKDDWASVNTSVPKRPEVLLRILRERVLKDPVGV